MDQYLPILLILLAAAGFGLAQLRASQMLGPSRPTGAKQGPYESGIVPRTEAATRFPVRFYLIAMIFIIFDIEVVFLYPWAVMYHQLGTFGLGEMAVFVAIVFVALAYLISNGALDWGPAKRFQREVDLSRTTTTTVRRVRRFDLPAEESNQPPVPVGVAAGAAGATPQSAVPTPPQGTPAQPRQGVPAQPPQGTAAQPPQGTAAQPPPGVPAQPAQSTPAQPSEVPTPPQGIPAVPSEGGEPPSDGVPREGREGES